MSAMTLRAPDIGGDSCNVVDVWMERLRTSGIDLEISRRSFCSSNGKIVWWSASQTRQNGCIIRRDTSSPHRQVVLSRVMSRRDQHSGNGKRTRARIGGY